MGFPVKHIIMDTAAIILDMVITMAMAGTIHRLPGILDMATIMAMAAIIQVMGIIMVMAAIIQVTVTIMVMVAIIQVMVTITAMAPINRVKGKNSHINNKVNKVKKVPVTLRVTGTFFTFKELCLLEDGI